MKFSLSLIAVKVTAMMATVVHGFGTGHHHYRHRAAFAHTRASTAHTHPSQKSVVPTVPVVAATSCDASASSNHEQSQDGGNSKSQPQRQYHKEKASLLHKGRGLAASLKRRVAEWSVRSAKRAASLYLNPATTKIGQVKVSWEPDMAQHIKMMRKQQKKTRGRPFMVGIVGIPGSGKSTSSDILASLLPKSIVMPMDGYHYPMQTLQKFPDAATAIYRRGAPDTFDPAALERDLKRIVYGNERHVSIPGFDHAKGDPEPNLHTFYRSKHDIVICEGIYLMHDQDGWENIKSYLDWSVYIDADIDVCIERLKQRNKCIPGYTPEEIELRCDQVDRKNAEMVERSRHFAKVEVKSGAMSTVFGLTKEMQQEMKEFVDEVMSKVQEVPPAQEAPSIAVAGVAEVA